MLAILVFQAPVMLVPGCRPAQALPELMHCMAVWTTVGLIASSRLTARVLMLARLVRCLTSAQLMPQPILRLQILLEWLAPTLPSKQPRTLWQPAE